MAAEPGHLRSAARLWAGWLLAPLAWALHLSLGYGLVPWVCRHDATGWLHAIGVGTVLLALAGVALAWRNLQHERRRGAGMFAAVGGGRFMGWVGMLIGVLFTALIIVQALPPLLTGPCG